ncbi:MAG TPA: PEP/pyruvate-binding domain-containing protein, partial [Kofleriaceae bacterium]|nr:PEP/pyruvate-binding domain-containing protein [Kofleriaceae bacterium]
LFALRWRIYKAPMDPTFRTALADAIRTRWGEDVDLRFRSSTNAEDLENFNGAGLYTSAGANLVDGEQALEDAVKVVWASAWNYQAFVERDWYRVDHTRVYMGVLVHPALEGELANGVALTINEFTPLRPAFYINSQIGEISVTNPTGQAVPEQILYYTWYEEPEYEVITRSSLTGGQPVLTEAQLDELASYLEAIHIHFNEVDPEAGNVPMDVEWKLAPDGHPVIKQARPLREKSTL